MLRRRRSPLPGGPRGDHLRLAAIARYESSAPQRSVLVALPAFGLAARAAAYLHIGEILRQAASDIRAKRKLRQWPPLPQWAKAGLAIAHLQQVGSSGNNEEEALDVFIASELVADPPLPFLRRNLELAETCESSETPAKAEEHLRASAHAVLADLGTGIDDSLESWAVAHTQRSIALTMRQAVACANTRRRKGRPSNDAVRVFCNAVRLAHAFNRDSMPSVRDLADLLIVWGVVEPERALRVVKDMEAFDRRRRLTS